MEPLEEFKQFLIDNNCLESYLYNLKHFKFSSVSSYPFKELIIYAFKWNATKERRDFWNKLDTKWIKRTRNYDKEYHYTFTEIYEYLNVETENLWTD